jgi:hypothetical protein
VGSGSCLPFSNGQVRQNSGLPSLPKDAVKTTILSPCAVREVGRRRLPSAKAIVASRQRSITVPGGHPLRPLADISFLHGGAFACRFLLFARRFVHVLECTTTHSRVEPLFVWRAQFSLHPVGSCPALVPAFAVNIIFTTLTESLDREGTGTLAVCS